MIILLNLLLLFMALKSAISLHLLPLSYVQSYAVKTKHFAAYNGHYEHCINITQS